MVGVALHPLGRPNLVTRANRFVVCGPFADLALRGTLHSVDQYLNIKLLNVSVEDATNFPHMVTRPLQKS